VIGCVYIYPDKTGGTEAEVRSWVKESRAKMDVPVWRVVDAWLEESWPFRSFDYAGRAEPLDPM
jgi:hypothetical protein